MSNYSQPPQPLSPLSYEPPQRQLRPGVMTAVGVLSIIIACLSGLQNLGSVATAALFGVSMGRMTVPVAIPTTGPVGQTTAPTTSTTAVPTTMVSPFNVPPALLILTGVGGVLGLSAAAVLFAAGVQVLRNRRSGAKLHWIFIAIKVPVVLFVAVVTYLFTASMMRSMSTVVPGTPLPATMSNWFAVLQVVMTVVISLAYPLALVFVLRSRTARDYFASLTM